MCLYKLHHFPKISSKPIKCYKLIQIHKKGLDYNICKTGCIEHIFKLGDKIYSESHPMFGIFKKLLTNQVVHAYTLELRSINYMRRSNNDNFTYKYIECEIPPFTFYYLGIGDEIGASVIKTIKIVE